MGVKEESSIEMRRFDGVSLIWFNKVKIRLFVILDLL